MNQNKLTSRIEKIKERARGRHGRWNSEKDYLFEFEFPWAIDQLEKAIEVVRFYADEKNLEIRQNIGRPIRQRGDYAREFLEGLNK